MGNEDLIFVFNNTFSLEIKGTDYISKSGALSKAVLAYESYCDKQFKSMEEVEKGLYDDDEYEDRLQTARNFYELKDIKITRKI